MAKLEIVKRNLKEVIVYIISLLLLTILLWILFTVELTELLYIILGITAFLTGLAIFKIIPNLGIKKHTKVGELIPTDKQIELKNVAGQGTFDIKKLSKIKIEVLGYDGQSRTGSSYSQGQGVRPGDGLGNNISYIRQGRLYKYEFYLESIPQSDAVKDIIRKWISKYRHIESKVIR